MYSRLVDHEGFHVIDDQTAEWSIKAIKEHEDERDRLVDVCRMEIERLEEEIDAAYKRCESSTAYLRSELMSYMSQDTTKVKITKTQMSYRLPSGKLVKHLDRVGYEYDNDELAEWLKRNGHDDLVVHFDAPRLSAAKKLIATVDGETAVTADGEVIQGITAVKIPPRFEIKFGGGMNDVETYPDHGGEREREDYESEDA